MIYDGKRYRIHNNYLTLGPGFLGSTIRNQSQKCIAIDFQFHIKTQQFQGGVMMSGNEFQSNNNIQLHVGYGYRRETKATNLAAFVGPTYFTGVEGDSSTKALFYDGFGLYGCLQAVTKFSYDMGLGAEVFGEVNYKQKMFGFKIVLFFSGAYRGQRKNFNSNVHSERK